MSSSYYGSNTDPITTTTTNTVTTTTTGTEQIQVIEPGTEGGSSGIFAYYASDDPDYFPDFLALKERDPQSVPFSFVSVEPGKKYRIKNEFSSEEGFNVQLWYSNTLDSAYGLKVDKGDFIRADQIGRGTTVDVVAEGRFLFAGTYDHTIVNPELPLTYGYEMKGTIGLVIESDGPPTVEDEDLFMIQHEGELYRIEAYELKQYFAGIAKPENLVQDEFGEPGLMFPGTGLTFNEITGKVDAVIPARPNFLGIIRDESFIPAPWTNLVDDSPHPLHEAPVVSSPRGVEEEGDYYVVYDEKLVLNEAWGYSSGSQVYRGDTLIRVRHGDNPGDWEIIPSIVGATTVLGIKKAQDDISIDTSDLQFPQIVIRTAAAAGDSTLNENGYDGFLSKEDKNTINRLPLDYTEQDYTKYPPIE